MKSKGVLIFIFIVLAFYGFSAWGQYTWRDRFLKSVGGDWIVFDEQNNSADFLYPYTIILPPVSRLGLIQKSSINRIAIDTYKYNTMWSDGPVGNSMPTEQFLSFADCNKNLDGHLKKGVETFTNLNDIEWDKPDSNPYVTTSQDKALLVEKFGKECRLLKKLSP